MTQYWYTFIDRSPTEWSEDVISSRKAITTVTCKTLPISFGGYAGWDNRYDDNGLFSGDYIKFKNPSTSNKTELLYVPEQVAGSTTYVSYMTKSCGPRCAFMYALQSVDNDTIFEPALFQCNNTVPHIQGWQSYGAANIFDMPTYQAHIMAGAIGWSGFTTDELDYQSTVYAAYSLWSPSGGVSTLDMSRVIMEFTAGAFAALDYNGQRQNVTGEWQPSQAQIVAVEWRWAVVVLAAIPVTQAIVLVFVIGWANKAVIKDTSFLATAKLLAPVVGRLGDRGCLLTGDEIAEELGNYRIIYGPRFLEDGGRGVRGGGEGDEGLVKHLDVIAEEEGLDRWHGRMPAGRYDGMGTWREQAKGEGEGKRRKGRRRRLSV